MEVRGLTLQSESAGGSRGFDTAVRRLQVSERRTQDADCNISRYAGVFVNLYAHQAQQNQQRMHTQRLGHACMPADRQGMSYWHVHFDCLPDKSCVIG